MIDILLAAIVIILGFKISELINNHRLKKKQYTFIYCPKCRNEMIKNGKFIEDNDGIVKYCCSKCGIISFWDFGNFPVPMLRTCGHCEHLIDEGLGTPYCKKENVGECSPDTQVRFECKRKETL